MSHQAPDPQPSWQQPQHQQPPRPPARARRRKTNRIILSVFSGIIIFILGITIGASSSGDSGSSSPSPATTTTVTAAAPTVTVTAKAAVNAASTGATIGEGTFLVGKDVKAGTYSVTVPSDSNNCYWQRAQDSSGNMDSIIANNNLNPGAHGTVTVQNGETFTSTGCGTWTRN